MNKSAGGVWELAAAVLFTTLGVLFAARFPLFSMVLLPVFGAPAFIISRSKGFFGFTLYALFTCLAVAFSASPETAFDLFHYIMMPGLFLGAAVNLGIKPMNSICIALCSAIVFSYGWLTFASGYFPKLSPMQQRKAYVQQTSLVAESYFKELSKKVPEVKEKTEELKKSFAEAIQSVTPLIPVVPLFFTHVMNLGIFYWAASLFFKNREPGLPVFPSFSEWQLDWKLIWLYLFGFTVCLALPDNIREGLPSLVNEFGMNCLLLSNVIYYIAGMSLVFFMFNKYQIGMFGRISLFLLALIFSQAVIWFGIIDVWADFRSKGSVQNASESDDSD